MVKANEVHNNETGKLSQGEFKYAEFTLRIEQTQIKMDSTWTIFQASNASERVEYELQNQIREDVLAWHEETERNLKSKVINVHGEAAHQERTQVMDKARTQIIFSANESSSMCGEHEEAHQDAVDAWEMRCLSPGIVWAGVSAGPKHTCALAKQSAHHPSGALCCWGGQCYVASFEIMQPYGIYRVTPMRRS